MSLCMVVQLQAMGNGSDECDPAHSRLHAPGAGPALWLAREHADCGGRMFVLQQMGAAARGHHRQSRHCQLHACAPPQAVVQTAKASL